MSRWGRSSTRWTRTGARARSAPSASPTGRCRGSTQANAYAAERGVAGIACNSPHLSLAVQNEPPWAGCLSATDAESRAWHARTGLPLLAWSAQAGGCFAGAATRVYDNAANRERRARAEQLGDANAVALAWVLAQPFPTIAIIGPHSLEHLHASLEALAVELSADETAGSTSRRDYSVALNSHTAMPSITRPSARITPASSSAGSRQPHHVTPGSSASRAAGLMSRCWNTSRRIGSTA